MKRLLLLLLTTYTLNLAYSQSAQLIQDVNFSTTEYEAKEFTEFNGKLYFTANSDEYGRELFVYDTTLLSGNQVSTVQLTPTKSTTYGDPKNLIVFNNKLYFSYNDSVVGRELYSLNNSGTIQLESNLNPSAANSNPENLIVYKNNLYFVASNSSSGPDLFKFSGVGVPSKVTSLSSSSFSGAFQNSEIIIVRDTLFFDVENSAGNFDFYKYGGNLTPTFVTGLSSDPSELTAFNNQLYFSYFTSSAGQEVFKLNGNSGLINLITTNINFGSGSSFPSELTVFEGKIFFNADDGSDSYLYTIDSSDVVRRPNSGSITYPTDFVVFDNHLFFNASDASGSNYSLYKYRNGSFISFYQYGNPNYSDAKVFFTFGNSLYAGNARKLGLPVRKAVARITQLPTSIDYLEEFNAINQNTNNAIVQPYFAISFRNKWVFSAKDNEDNTQLFEATRDTVVQLTSLNAFSRLSSITSGAIVNNELYFSYNAFGMHAIYKYDGSSVVRAASVSGFPAYHLFELKGKLYCSYLSSSTGTEIYKLSAGSLQLVNDFEPGSISSNFSHAITLRDTAYLVKGFGTNSGKLHYFDSANINALPINSYNSPTLPVVFHNSIYFASTVLPIGSIRTPQIWEVKNTSNAPQIKSSLANYADVRGMAVHDKRLYFSGYNVSNNTGYYIYSLDTLGNLDSVPTPGVTWCSQFTSVEDNLFYTGIGPLGMEAYYLDSNNQTNLLEDILLGISGSSPALLTNVNDTLFFSANHPRYGFEPYYAKLCTLDNSVTVSGNSLTANLTGATYQWIDCSTNLPITSATNQTFTPSVSGSYACEITSPTCSQTSVCNTITIGTSSLKESSFVKVLIYPNPTNGLLTIKSSHKIQNIQLLDVNGRFIFNSKDTILDVSHLANGVYFVKISSENENIIKKIIKQ